MKKPNDLRRSSGKSGMLGTLGTLCVLPRRLGRDREDPPVEFELELECELPRTEGSFEDSTKECRGSESRSLPLRDRSRSLSGEYGSVVAGT